MPDEKTPSENGEQGRDGPPRRPYSKPAIVEEEAYETCAILACAQKTRSQPGCRARVDQS